jgi:hypothetical protein
LALLRKQRPRPLLVLVAQLLLAQQLVAARGHAFLGLQTLRGDSLGQDGVSGVSGVGEDVAEEVLYYCKVKNIFAIFCKFCLKSNVLLLLSNN